MLANKYDYSSENTDPFFLPLKQDFNFIMFMKYSDSCPEHSKYQMKLVLKWVFILF